MRRCGCSRSCGRPPTPITPGCGSSIYGAVQQLILAARAYGIGTTLTSLYAGHEAEVRELLGLPADALTMALLPMGYPSRGRWAEPSGNRWRRSCTGIGGGTPGSTMIDDRRDKTPPDHRLSAVLWDIDGTLLSPPAAGSPAPCWMR